MFILYKFNSYNPECNTGFPQEEFLIRFALLYSTKESLGQNGFVIKTRQMRQSLLTFLPFRNICDAKNHFFDCVLRGVSRRLKK